MDVGPYEGHSKVTLYTAFIIYSIIFLDFPWPLTHFQMDQMEKKTLYKAVTYPLVKLPSWMILMLLIAINDCMKY